MLVSVAVAWACVLWAPGPPSSPIAWEPIEPGGRWPRPVHEDWPSPQKFARVTSLGWTHLYSYSPIDPLQSPAQGEVINFGQSVFQSGWPLRAIEYEARVVQRHARAYSRPGASVTGKASMSARSSTPGPSGFLARRIAAIPV